MNNEVIIIGMGGHGKVVLDAILSNRNSDLKVIGFLDDGDLQEVYGIKKLGRIEDAREYKDKKFHIAIGNNKFREKVAKDIGEENLITVIHKTAYISSMSSVGKGSYIGAMAVINPECEVGTGCIINTGTIVEHESKVGNFSHLSYQVLVGSNSYIGNLQTIEMGKILERNTVVGRE